MCRRLLRSGKNSSEQNERLPGWLGRLKLQCEKVWERTHAKDLWGLQELKGARGSQPGKKQGPQCYSRTELNSANSPGEFGREPHTLDGNTARQTPRWEPVGHEARTRPNLAQKHTKCMLFEATTFVMIHSTAIGSECTSVPRRQDKIQVLQKSRHRLWI